MKRNLLAPLFLVLLLFSACSSVEVVNSWKADNAPTLKTKNTLVIVRTNNMKARVAFEEAIAEELRKKDIQATESYKRIPKLNPNKKLTETELEEAKDMLRKASFNGVVLTVLKDKNSIMHGEYQAAHVAGASYASNFPTYYAGFYGYYNHPTSHLVSEGQYVEESFDIKESITYVLETLAYNLDEPLEKQLVASVVSKIEEPESANEAAKQYASKIVNSLKQK